MEMTRPDLQTQTYQPNSVLAAKLHTSDNIREDVSAAQESVLLIAAAAAND